MKIEVRLPNKELKVVDVDQSGTGKIFPGSIKGLTRLTDMTAQTAPKENKPTTSSEQARKATSNYSLRYINKYASYPFRCD